MKKLLISAGFASLLGCSSPGWADIAVIVSQQSPLTTLDIHDVKMMFMGKIGSFPDGRKVKAIDPPKSSTREHFYRTVASKTPHQMAAYWSRMMFTGAGMPPLQAASVDDVLQQVANDRSAISYVDSAKLTPGVREVLRVPVVSTLGGTTP